MVIEDFGNHTIGRNVTVENNGVDIKTAPGSQVRAVFAGEVAAVQNISECLHHNIPIVSGTTGWLEHYDDMTSLCTSKNGAFIYGSNFSLGVNLFFELNAHLAKIMSRFNQYEVSMEEIHHTQKLDKPSGTAITLAQNIIKEKNLSSWSIENPNENELFIDVKRIDSVPGTHSISYTSEVDTIEITHTAHNRDGFALGAVIASEWLINKKGIYTMKDVLGL